MKTRFYNESDNWTADGRAITSESNLDAVRAILRREGSVLVKHWLYRAATGPEYRIFDEYEAFIEFLIQETYAGDAIDIWSLWEICHPDKIRAQGKCPDENGLVPQGGAY